MAQFGKHPKTKFISIHCLIHFSCFRASRRSSLICITATSFLSLLIHFPYLSCLSARFFQISSAFFYMCRSSGLTSQVTRTDAQRLPADPGQYEHKNKADSLRGRYQRGVVTLLQGTLAMEASQGPLLLPAHYPKSSLRLGLKMESLQLPNRGASTTSGMLKRKPK